MCKVIILRRTRIFFIFCVNWREIFTFWELKVLCLLCCSINIAEDWVRVFIGEPLSPRYSFPFGLLWTLTPYCLGFISLFKDSKPSTGWANWAPQQETRYNSNKQVIKVAQLQNYSPVLKRIIHKQHFDFVINVLYIPLSLKTLDFNHLVDQGCEIYNWSKISAILKSQRYLK